MRFSNNSKAARCTKITQKTKSTKIATTITHIFLLRSNRILLLMLPKKRPKSHQRIALRGRTPRRLRHHRPYNVIVAIRRGGDGTAVAGQAEVASRADGDVVAGVAGASSEEAGEGAFFRVVGSLRDLMRIQHPLVALANLANIHRDSIPVMSAFHRVISTIMSLLVRRRSRLLGPSSLPFSCHGYVLLLEAIIIVGHDRWMKRCVAWVGADGGSRMPSRA